MPWTSVADPCVQFQQVRVGQVESATDPYKGALFKSNLIFYSSN